MVKPKGGLVSEGELTAAQPRRLSSEEVLLGAAVLLPPVAWSLDLALCYGLVYPAFDWQSKISIHAVSALAGAVSIAGAALGLRALRRAGGDRGDESEQQARVRFLAICAFAGGVLFLLAIAAQSVPAFMLPLGKHG
jgi:hypothetical protein